MKISLLLVASCLVCYADALSTIVGPVTAFGTSPWSYYDLASKGNADLIIPSALMYPPIRGAAAATPMALADTCVDTLTGTAASEFSIGDWIIVGWDAAAGAGTGHFLFSVTNKVGDVLSGQKCGLDGLVPAGTYTVYHCTTQCKDEIVNGNGFHNYDCATWAFCNNNGNPWNFYDSGLALYRMYLRTGNMTYLTNFRAAMDLWWLWAMDQGGRQLIPPRGFALSGQFVAALDGHSERFPALYKMINLTCCGQGPNGGDNRESGYMLLYSALGAIADSDATRRTSYCSMVSTQATQWLTAQNSLGHWPEKNGFYPYDVGGVSPWRMFALVQGLAFSYEAMHDPTICNNSTLAASILVSVKKAADFMFNYGYTTNLPHSVYYDVEYAADGQDGQGGGVRPGTVSVALTSTAVTGVGTSFTTLYAPCDGTTFIGIYDPVHDASWTHRVTACADNTHLTIATAYGTQCYVGIVTTCATTDAVALQFFMAPAAYSNCASMATYCWESHGVDGAGLAIGNVDNARDLIWIHGWLYKTTGITQYKTHGDLLFAVAAGGSANGPGDNFPGTPAPCDGPNCSDVETGYAAALPACAWNGGVLPCSTVGYSLGNVWGAYSKQWAQGSGIGGMDNYLCWRDPTCTGVPAVPAGRLVISGHPVITGRPSIP